MSSNPGTGSVAGGIGRWADLPVVRVLAYYVLLFAGTALLARFFPDVVARLTAYPQGASAESLQLNNDTVLSNGPVFAGGEGVALSALLAMAGACLLMLPVAWVYIQTRRKKGFRQSVVQTLIILPLVVAGVVILVKNSLALAFSLGGIVAAVSFRNTLRDTKDAVYIFLATGVGLASGVQAIGVAAALSVAFNLVILLLWWTDFGRAPAALRGPPAEQRMRRALALANRTNAFVSMVDREILKSLSQEQLQAVSDRAVRRRDSAAASLSDEKQPKIGNAPLQQLHVQVIGALDPARRAVEGVLEADAKRWEFVSAVAREGGHMLEYRVRPRKRIPGDQLAQRIRAGAAPAVVGAELKQPVASGTPRGA